MSSKSSTTGLDSICLSSAGRYDIGSRKTAGAAVVDVFVVAAAAVVALAVAFAVELFIILCLDNILMMV
jgi:hypothetical protein